MDPSHLMPEVASKLTGQQHPIVVSRRTTYAVELQQRALHGMRVAHAERVECVQIRYQKDIRSFTIKSGHQDSIKAVLHR